MNYIDLDLNAEDVYNYLDPDSRPCLEEYKKYTIEYVKAAEYKLQHGIHIEMLFRDARGRLMFFEGNSDCCKPGCSSMGWKPYVT